MYNPGGQSGNLPALFFRQKSCQSISLASDCKASFPARLDKMRHCDMGPQKFTYCPLRLIQHFTFFWHISHLQRRILQKTFIRTFPQANRPTMALFHRVNALPLHRFFPPSLPQKIFFCITANFFCRRGPRPTCNPTAQGITIIRTPWQAIHEHG